jgi:hypothetical protein
VYNYTRAQGEREEIRHRERSGQIKGRVVFVGSHIECVLRREHPRHIVLLTEAIKGLGAEHREVRKIPSLEAREETRKRGIRNTYVCVVQDGGEDPVEYYKTSKYVHLGPPGDYERTPDP